MKIQKSGFSRNLVTLFDRLCTLRLKGQLSQTRQYTDTVSDIQATPAILTQQKSDFYPIPAVKSLSREQTQEGRTGVAIRTRKPSSLPLTVFTHPKMWQFSRPPEILAQCYLHHKIPLYMLNFLTIRQTFPKF